MWSAAENDGSLTGERPVSKEQIDSVEADLREMDKYFYWQETDTI